MLFYAHGVRVVGTVQGGFPPRREKKEAKKEEKVEKNEEKKSRTNNFHLDTVWLHATGSLS